MKKLNLLLLILVMTFAGILFFPSCDLLNLSEDEEEKAGVSETIFTNPEDPQIIQLDSAGRKVTYLGTKDADGMPVSITRALVDGELMTAEAQTVIDFDSEGRATSLSSELYGYMTLEYVSDTQVVIVYSLPDNEGSYQLTYNPYSQEKTGDCGCPESGPGNEVEYKMRTDQYMPEELPLILKPEEFVNTKSVAMEGNVYTFFNQTANPVVGNTVSGTYTTHDGKSGAVGISKVGAGHFTYSMPTLPAPPEPPAGFTDKARSLLNKVCYGAIPVALAKHAICLKFVHPLAILKCEATLTAYVWLCRINTTYRVGEYVYDLHTADKNVTITSLHPTLPAKSKSITVSGGQTHLSDVNIVYDSHAVIGSLTTIPSDPAPSQGYTIKCVILNGIPNVDGVKLSMTGSDGYSSEQTFTLDASLSCSMSIPGAIEGVKDVITATVINANPQAGQSKTISIIF